MFGLRSLAVNRSSELVSDHHGSGLHCTAGCWALVRLMQHLADKPEWLALAAVTGAAQANRHVQVGETVGGPVSMPDIPAAPAASAEEAVAALESAVHAQHPVDAEQQLLAALEHGATPAAIMSSLLDMAVPRNSLDDHYFLYPIFTMRTLEQLGWEHAPTLLRPVRSRSLPCSVCFLSVGEFRRSR